MRKTLLAAAIAGVFSLPAVVLAQAAAPAAPASPHTLTGNVGLVSNYIFRGISQSAGKPALQGGFDYAHASGLYAGTWASNVNWVADNYGGAGLPSASNSLEIDVYGGYKGTITGDLGYDLGLITYNYPGSNTTVGGTFIKPDSTEIYGALSWKWLTIKYSHSTTSLFGWNKFGGTVNDKTNGSGYLEINGAFDLGGGWGVSAHVGDQKIKGNGPASYTDYKLGVTKDAGYGVFGLALTATNSNGSCTAGAPTTANDVYCWGTAPGKSAYDSGKSAAVLSFSKTF